MHANNAAAVWTTMPFSLAFKKFYHALLFYHFDVFNHAHTVAFAVAFVKVRKLLAGNRVALAAGLDLLFSKFWAAPYNVAVFGSWKATCAMSYFALFRWYSVSVCVICFAKGAVHAARRNKFWVEFGFGH